ncbi:hypothetical protein LBMAG53_19980 [Planctomycetota bacterium]|nr:hypothetical protein LBMAG53_19980 [Planctomycetota bacterium]
MASKRLRKFGRALGTLPDDRTTLAQWSAQVGEEMETVKGLLIKQGPAGAVWLHAAGGGAMTRYRVVAHSKMDLVGVDDDTGDRVPLTLETAQLYAADWDRIVPALRDGLNLSGPYRPVSDMHHTWEVGRCALTDERSALVYLVAAPRDQMAAILDRLVATGVQEAVVLVGDAAAVNAEAVARLRGRKVQVVGIADAIALDERRRLVGVAGPESVVGDLRALMGLAPRERPPYQMSRNGARCDIVFRGLDIAVDFGVGVSALANLLGKPNAPCSAVAIQAATHCVEPRLLSGSKGVRNDRQSRDEARERIRKLTENMRRHGSGHIEYDRWEAERGQLLTMVKDGDGLGGADVQQTTAAAAGRAVGGAIKRAIAAIAKEGEAGKSFAAYLEDTIRDPTGQHPCYRPGDQAPDWLIAM